MKFPGVLVAAAALVDGATIPLDEAELHHLHVRRIVDGAVVSVFDGNGVTARGRFRGDGRTGAVEIEETWHLARPVTTLLAVGAGDKDRFVALAERCTELGVTDLVPLLTARSRTVDTRVRASMIDRVRRRACEACKQSGNPWATAVSEPMESSALADRFPSLQWFTGVPGAAAVPAIDRTRGVGWVIGPEGGFTADEVEALAHDPGAQPVSVGAAILRFDTAAIAAAVITRERRIAAHAEY